MYQGERAMTKDNILLGKFQLSGISPAPRGTPQIEVTFEVNADGILSVQALDKATSKADRITITADKSRLSEEEIERMMREAEEFAGEDKVVKETIDARNGLEGYVYSLKNSISDENKFRDKISPEDKQIIEEALNTAIEWLEDNKEATADDYDGQRKSLESTANPIMTKLYQQNGPQSESSEWSSDLPQHDDL